MQRNIARKSMVTITEDVGKARPTRREEITSDVISRMNQTLAAADTARDKKTASAPRA